MLAPTRASVCHEFGVDIALDHLRGNRRGAQTELLANVRFDFRRKMRAGADGAGKFSNGDDVAGALQAFQRAAKFVMHQRHFQTERRRLGVNAVAAPDARA